MSLSHLWQIWVNIIRLNAFISSLHRFVEQVESDCVAEDGEESVEAEDERDGDKESVPEPQHQVDFPIDNVLKEGGKRGSLVNSFSTWVSSQSPLWFWAPPAAPMLGTLQDTSVEKLDQQPWLLPTSVGNAAHMGL